MHRNILAALVGASALVPVWALGQAANQAPATQVTPAQPAANQNIPKAADFVKTVALSDQLEIQASQTALSKTQRDDVKQFAQKMIQDHTASSTKLKGIADGLKIDVPTALDADGNQALQKLMTASAADFDRSFADMQATAHQKAVGLFDQYGQGGDNAQLKQFAQDTLPTLRMHQQMADQLRTALGATDRVVGAVTGDRTTQTAQNQTTQTQTAQGQAGGQGQIVVQQPGPAIRVDTPPPQVTIQQAQPDVTVKQPQPEIIVRQAAPTINVDIPQPEIIVRMPQPEVNVAQAQPQVQVNQPPPQVQVLQPQQQAQVQVDKAQPQVVTQGDQQAKVQVQQADQPIVRYERADAQVKVNQPEGQPTIRYEQMAATDATKNNATTTPTATPTQTTTTAATTPAQGQQTTTPAAGQQTAAVNAANAAQTRQVAVLDLKGIDIVNERGDKLGDVDHLVTSTADNKTYVIMGHGGFLGLGEKQVALPLTDMWMNGKKLVVSGLTDDQIKRMPEWKPQATAYRDLTTGQTAVRVTQ